MCKYMHHSVVGLCRKIPIRILNTKLVQGINKDMYKNITGKQRISRPRRKIYIRSLNDQSKILNLQLELKIFRGPAIFFTFAQDQKCYDVPGHIYHSHK